MDIKRIRINFMNENYETILSKKLTSLPLKEDIIIKKSIEFFDDPEPCMLHRTAVMKRLFMEIYEEILQIENNTRLNSIPSRIKQYIDIEEKYETLEVRTI